MLHVSDDQSPTADAALTATIGAQVIQEMKGGAGVKSTEDPLAQYCYDPVTASVTLLPPFLDEPSNCAPSSAPLAATAKKFESAAGEGPLPDPSGFFLPALDDSQLLPYRVAFPKQYGPPGLGYYPHYYHQYLGQGQGQGQPSFLQHGNPYYPFYPPPAFFHGPSQTNQLQLQGQLSSQHAAAPQPVTAPHAAERPQVQKQQGQQAFPSYHPFAHDPLLLLQPSTVGFGMVGHEEDMEFDLTLPVRLPDAFDALPGAGQEHQQPPGPETSKYSIVEYPVDGGEPGLLTAAQVEADFLSGYALEGNQQDPEAAEGSGRRHVSPVEVITPELYHSFQMQPYMGSHGTCSGEQHPGAVGPMRGRKSTGSATFSGSGSPYTSTSSSKRGRSGAAAPISSTGYILGQRPSVIDGSEPLEPRPHSNAPVVIGPDGQVYHKPPYSYAALISRALRECGTGKLTLSGIYEWIKDKFPYYRTAEAAWQVPPVPSTIPANNDAFRTR